MPGRNTNPNITRQTELAQRWRDSNQEGRLYWKSRSNWRWSWAVNEIARIVDNGVLVRKFYSLDEIADYLAGETEPVQVVKHERRGRSE